MLKQKVGNKFFVKAIFYVLLFTISMSSFSQKNDMSKGDRYFDLNMFTDAIPFYILASKQGKPPEKEKALMQLANCYRITGEFELAEKTYQKILKNKKTPASSYFDYGLALKASSKYTEAIASFEKYKLKNVGDSANANRMIKSCLMAQQWLDEPIEYDIKLIEKANGPAPDFAANYYKNGIFFCSSREGSKKPLINFNGGNTAPALDYYYFDISVPFDSIKDPISFPGGLNSYDHEGPGTFTQDYNTLYLTKTVISDKSKASKRLKTLQIFISKRDSADNWKTPVSALPFNSFNYSTGHPSISIDGKRLYFMSDMPGGLGGTDIYYTELQKNGSWGKPVNLGKPINTIGNELFPFIDKDSTLYFSSNMHPGMGKLDIFSSKLLSDTSWSEPQNMRPPINTIGDDFAYVKDRQGNRGILSSDRFNGKGADDVYSFSHIQPFIIRVEGTDLKILDQTFYDGVVYKLVNDSTKAESILTSENGVYSVYVEPNVSYTLVARKDGFRYAKVGVTRFTPEAKHNIYFQLRPIDKTVKVGGTLYHLDSTQTKNLAKVNGYYLSLMENDSELSTQQIDEKSNYYFDYELTSGNTYVLKDSQDDQKYKKEELIVKDTSFLSASDTLNKLIDTLSFRLPVPYDSLLISKQDPLRYLPKDSLVPPLDQSPRDSVKLYPVALDTIGMPQKVVFKGLIVSSEGVKMSNVSIKLYLGDSLQNSSKSNGMGVFNFNLNPIIPEYIIFTSKPGYESREVHIKTRDFWNQTSSYFRIEMIEKERIDVSGTVKDKDSVIANAQLDVYSNIEATKTHLTDNQGEFKFSVNPDGEYSMMVNKKGYLPTKVDISLANVDENGDLDLSIEMDTLKVDKIFRMNIYYEFDKSDIKSASELELDRFISFMRINPTVSIELSAHTDEKGTDQYNLNLSRERARKVMNYLVSEGRIDKKRIISNGYGETQLIVKGAKTEEENQLNRRTEVKILTF